ncbi:MAG: preprotein translocase subunit SecG [Rikenellaceae bacterium]
MLYTICIGLILVASVLMILAVLVQSPKSGMAANFGASNQVMGVRQTSDFLEKFTWAMASTILVLSLLATVVMGGSEVLSTTSIGSDANSMLEQMQQNVVIPQAATEELVETEQAAEEVAE